MTRQASSFMGVDEAFVAGDAIHSAQGILTGEVPAGAKHQAIFMIKRRIAIWELRACVTASGSDHKFVQQVARKQFGSLTIPAKPAIAGRRIRLAWLHGLVDNSRANMLTGPHLKQLVASEFA